MTLNKPKYAILALVLCSAIAGCSADKSQQHTQDAKADTVKSTQTEQNQQSIAIEAMVVQQDAATIQPTQHFKREGQPSPYTITRIPPNTMTETDSETYAATTINPVYQTQTKPVSTFSIDVDTASYSNIRRHLNLGYWPVKEAVRIEEMVNYFNYDYPKPTTAEQPFSVTTEVAPSPWNPQTKLMRIALKGYQYQPKQLLPMNLVFLIDVSGSMSQHNKLPLLKRSFALLSHQLSAQDTVSIVVYAGASGLALEPTSGAEKDKILAALENLNAGGATNGSAGIRLAYDTARSQFIEGGINRVILATDGDYNVGTTDIEALKQLIKTERQSDVYLSILGFGQGNYSDELTETLSNVGNGNAYYIDSFNEARKVFAQELTGTLQTIAKDVKVQVEFNPAYVAEYRLLGYDNRQLQDQDFNNDKVDAGDIGSGHTVTAFYEVVMQDSQFRFNDPLRYQRDEAITSSARNNELAYVKLRYKQPDSDSSTKISYPVAVDAVKDSFAAASRDFKFASAVSAFGETLRKSTYAAMKLGDIRQIAQDNVGKDPWGYRHELLQLMDTAMTIENTSKR